MEGPFEERNSYINLGFLRSLLKTPLGNTESMKKAPRRILVGSAPRVLGCTLGVYAWLWSGPAQEPFGGYRVT